MATLTIITTDGDEIIFKDVVNNKMILNQGFLIFETADGKCHAKATRGIDEYLVEPNND